MAHDGTRESWERHPRKGILPTTEEPAQPSPPLAPPPGPEPSAAMPKASEIVAPPATPQEVPPIAPEEVRSSPPAPAATPPPAPAQRIVFDTYTGTIVRMETHHSGLWEFDFALDKPMRFVAGQYVSVFLPGMKPAPFSIASSPVERERIVLGIEVVGAVTGALSRMQPGDKVTLKGPFGRFVIGDDERKVCFLAGGIGITPFMSMLRWVRDTNPDKRAVLFYSCRREDGFMWREEIARMHETHPSIKAVLTLTGDAPADWRGQQGRICEAMIREELPDFKDYVFFTCGPPALIDAMFALLASMGVPAQQLRREAWH